MIICFSGTGNTARAVSQLAHLLGETDILMLEGDQLLNPENHTVDTADGRVIWAFPTYSWGVPPVIANYIARINATDAFGHRPHYMLTTYGDDMGYTDRQWRRLIETRGWQPAESYAVIMPNTYVAMKGFDIDSEELSLQKIERSVRTVEEVAARIAASTGGDMPVRGAFPWVKSRIIYPWFVRFEMSPRPFHSTSACNGCGLCSRSCPMTNIVMAGGKPQWSQHCALCLRCYHICPQRAVAYGKTTESKGQWQGSLRFLKKMK